MSSPIMFALLVALLALIGVSGAESTVQAAANGSTAVSINSALIGSSAAAANSNDKTAATPVDVGAAIRKNTSQSSPAPHAANSTSQSNAAVPDINATALATGDSSATLSAGSSDATTITAPAADSTSQAGPGSGTAAAGSQGSNTSQAFSNPSDVATQLAKALGGAGNADTTPQPVPPGNSTLADDPGVNYGPAEGCMPPTTPEPQPQGVTIQQLPANDRPNFIIILTDDQGWDDIGLHHPQKPGGRPEFVKTPNLDKFLLASKQFDNFYVAPMCSQTRAALLTGRDYPHTGTMLVNGGYDYINRGERTSAHIMADGGYQTAHFGKWHNGRTLGYEPWFMGFQESWFPDLYINMDNLMRHNGKYVQTYGLMEQDLMDKMLGYLDNKAANNSQPFYLYYAPNAIHQGFLRPGQGPKWQRPAPEPYLAKYRYLLEKNISQSTIEVWAMLEYMDDVLGRLFDYIDNSPLKDNTYVMIMSDNGSELFQGEMPNKLTRMPSGMQGYKRAVEEGGIRNFLAVKGPGIQAGTIDSTLLDVTDVLPTMVDLAGLQTPAVDDLAFTGVSFKNLLLTGPKAPATARLAQSLATPHQLDRFLFSLSPICWDPDSVPELDENREVIKPQKLLDFDVGGYDNDLYSYFYNDTTNSSSVGYERCIGVRYQDYKWIGRTNKVYRLTNNSHIELPCNEVTGSEGAAVAALMSGAARNWWNSLMASPHSFQKPTFYLGFEGWNVTNLLPDGAHERTFGRVKLLPNGASGFVQPGDRMCFAVEVVASGYYEVVPIYASKVQAIFNISVGKFSDILAGTSPSLTSQLPASVSMGGHQMGYLYLDATNGQKIDACLVLDENSAPGTPVFVNLGDLRFLKTDPSEIDDASAAEIVYGDRTSDSSSTGSDANDDETMDADSPAPVKRPRQGQQQQPGKRRRHRRGQHAQHVGQHQGQASNTTAQGQSTADSKSTTAKTISRFRTYHQPGSYNAVWVTKAMRQIIPGWLPSDSPTHNGKVEENPAMTDESLAARKAALGAAAAGRKGGPGAKASSTAAGPGANHTRAPGDKSGAAKGAAQIGHDTMNRGTAAAAPPATGKQASKAGRRAGAAAGALQDAAEPVHVAGQQGVTRQRMKKRRVAPVAKPANGISIARDFQKLFTADNTLGPSPSATGFGSRMRLAAPAAETEEVIGATPDRHSSSAAAAGQDGAAPRSSAGPADGSNKLDSTASTAASSVGNLSAQKADGMGSKRNANRAGVTDPNRKAVGVKQKQAGSRDGQRNKDTAAVQVHTEIPRKYLKPTTAMQETERQALKAAAAAKAKERLIVDSGAVGGADAAAWRELRMKNNWPDGQGRLESMYSPYHVEMIDMCKECQPRL